jgi:DNA-directed RNA polymerase specialized sigma24 family protein
MHSTIKILIPQYCESLKKIRSLKNKVKKRHTEQAKADATLISSMERDVEWAIEYMATGYMPLYSEGEYKKTIPVDPQKVLEKIKQPTKQSLPWWKELQLEIEIKKILDELTPREIEAFLLVKAEGFSYSEAAEFLEIKKSTVQTLVERAWEKARRACHTTGLYK